MHVIPAAFEAHRSDQADLVQPIVLVQKDAKRLLDAATHARRHGLAHGLQSAQAVGGRPVLEGERQVFQDRRFGQQIDRPFPFQPLDNLVQRGGSPEADMRPGLKVPPHQGPARSAAGFPVGNGFAVRPGWQRSVAHVGENGGGVEPAPAQFALFQETEHQAAPERVHHAHGGTGACRRFCGLPGPFAPRQRRWFEPRPVLLDKLLGKSGQEPQVAGPADVTVGQSQAPEQISVIGDAGCREADGSRQVPRLPGQVLVGGKEFVRHQRVEKGHVRVLRAQGPAALLFLFDGKAGGHGAGDAVQSCGMTSKAMLMRCSSVSMGMVPW